MRALLAFQRASNTLIAHALDINVHTGLTKRFGILGGKIADRPWLTIIGSELILCPASASQRTASVGCATSSCELQLD
jgi:hypothetical protein